MDASRSCGGYATCMDALCNNMFFAVLTDFTMLVKTRIETPIKNWIYDYYVNEFTEVAHWIGKTLGLIQPLRPQKNILKKTADDLNNLTREVIKQYCHRASSGSYTGTHLFEDYTKLFVQFGYLMLFLPALPLVSVICFFTCWTDLKLDAQKLFDDYLRPFPEGSPDIGSWRSCFNYMALIAIPTNAGVVVFTMNAFNTTSFTLQLIIFIGMQWVIFVILFIAQAIYSGESLKVTVQRGRAKNIIQNLENLVGDNKLKKSDNQLRAQMAETERVTKLNAELDAKNKKLERTITNMREQQAK